MSITIDVAEVSSTDLKSKDVVVVERENKRHTCYVVFVCEDMVYTNCGWFDYSEILASARIKTTEKED